MTYYNKLNIGSYFGQTLVVGTDDGRYLKGVLEIDLLNEDWEEDGEKEAFVLRVDGKLIAIEMDTVHFITKTSDIEYMQEAAV